MEIFVLLITVAVIMAGFGGWVASQKNRPFPEGLILGFLFGPLGVLVEALMPNLSKKEGQSGRGEDSKRGIDEQGQIAYIANRFRDVLDASDPNWRGLPYRTKGKITNTAEKQIMKELNLTPTKFSELAAEARREIVT
jgi:hypothetical protein